MINHTKVLVENESRSKKSMILGIKKYSIISIVETIQ